MSMRTWWTAGVVVGLLGACSTVGPTGTEAPGTPREPAPVIPGDTLVPGPEGPVSLDDAWTQLPPRLSAAEGAQLLVDVDPEQVVDDTRYTLLARTSSPGSKQTPPKPRPTVSKPDRGGSWSPGGSYVPPRSHDPNKPRGGSWTPPRHHLSPGPRPTWHPTSKPSWRPSHRPSHRWDRDHHRNYWRTRYKYKSGSIYYFPYGRYYYPYYYYDDYYYPYTYNNYPFLYYDNGSYYPYTSDRTSDPGTAVEDATVVIYENRFLPDRVLLKPGGQVRWVNMDRVDHTATPERSDQFPETGEIGPGATSEPVTIGGRGEIRYYCEFHSTMRGTIVVE